MQSATSIKRERLLEEVVILWLTVGTAVGVLPFAIFRLFEKQWFIGAFDSVIVIAMVSLGVYVFKTGRTQIARWLISALLIAGMLTTVMLKGAGQFVWAYPATVAIYYLVKHQQAVTINAIAIVTLGLITYSSMPVAIWGSSMVTLIATNVFALIFASRTNKQREQLIRQTTKDPLTKAGNRRAFDLEISRVVKEQHRKQFPISMISIDLDHFKDINDNYGHAKGDEVLIMMTNILTMRLRGTDNLYRIGGEEFVIVPVNANLENAEKLAEQLRTLVEASELLPELPLTISLGVAEYRNNESEQEWLQRADKALYQAKNTGRNRTCLSE